MLCTSVHQINTHPIKIAGMDRIAAAATTTTTTESFMEEFKMNEGDTALVHSLKKKVEMKLQSKSVWRSWISKENQFQPQAGRYHLYASCACPDSQRALIIRSLKGLEKVVSVSIVKPILEQSNPNDPLQYDWILQENERLGDSSLPKVTCVRAIYEAANDYSTNYTLPILWDKKLQTIVNNNASDVCQMLNSSFGNLLATSMDVYKNFEKRVQASEWLFPLLSTSSQQRMMDCSLAIGRANAILQKQRYLTSTDTITEADITLFVSLCRYECLDDCNQGPGLVAFSPALLNFCREIYQMGSVSSFCNLKHILLHHWGYVDNQKLAFIDLLQIPHNRHTL